MPAVARRPLVIGWLLSPRVPVLPRSVRFAVAPAAVLVGYLVQSAMLRQPGIAPFVFFFVSVAVTSWVGGRAPGLLSALLSALVANYFFVAPFRAWSLSSQSLTATALFLIAAGVVAFLCASFRQAALDLQQALARQGRTERALRESEEALRETDRRKDEFLGVLSHELRNPLAPIRSAVHVLGHPRASSEQARRAREIIERQTDHMAALVDELLDVTRIARGKIELQRRRVDLREVARRTGEDHRALLERRGIELAIDLSPEPCFADADPVRLAQIIGNLLQNAAKFTGGGGRVVLAVAAREDAVRIEVSDSGVGIEPALLPHIFEPFTQGPQNLARTEGGLGLGLPLVKSLAELHGGTASARSEGPGRGAEFVVTLPRAAADVPPGEARAADARPARVRRVLVVDDNADAAESLAQLVQVFGHCAEVAFDGPSAIERVRANPPDFLLCDIGLPGMSGYEIARSLREERRRGMQLVALSGYALPEDLKAASEAGFDRHIAKPPKPEEIERLLA